MNAPRQFSTTQIWRGVLVCLLLLVVTGAGAALRFGWGPFAPAGKSPQSAPQPAKGTEAGEKVAYTEGTPPPVPSADCSAGSAWRAVASPNLITNEKTSEIGKGGNNLAAIAALSPRDAWAVGLAHGEGRSAELTEHWDGSAWHTVPSVDTQGSASTLNAVCVTVPGLAWAAGSHLDRNSAVVPLLIRWNGISWTPASTPALASNYATLQGISALSQDDVWAVGYLLDDKSAYRALTEHWDGKSWHVVPGPEVSAHLAQLMAVWALSSYDVWAVGEYSPSAGVINTLVEHWDGKSWQVVSSPNGGPAANYLTGISGSKSDDVWAVGYSGNEKSVYRTLIEHWDGHSWRIIPSPNNGEQFNLLTAVSATPMGEAWTVGYYQDVDRTQKALVEKWDGRSWRLTGVPSIGPTLNLLRGVSALSGSDAWVVGYSDSLVGTAQTLIERFNNPCVTPGP
ncbi:MAG: hypothetical protein M3014_04015 [Chloroflexota bacterium]|nr:hypothetical protein [Chloroflexota bacterium]